MLKHVQESQDWNNFVIKCYLLMARWKVISGVVLSIILRKNHKSCDMQIFDKNGNVSTTNIGLE